MKANVNSDIEFLYSKFTINTYSLRTVHEEGNLIVVPVAAH